MKEKISKMFKDKLFLVMLVLGLLTIVAAAGVVTIQRGNQIEQKPYLEMQDGGGMIAEETVPETKVQLAGDSNARPAKESTAAETEEATKALTQGKIEEPVAEVGAEKEAAAALVLNFNKDTKMTWPVKGNVLLDYSMESTIYFPTLEQYKCNPAVVIQSEVSSPVLAPANARIREVGSNEELGNYVVLDMGNDYTAVCGQLKELNVVENEYIRQGEVLGYVSEPTKYYSVEGTNVYFELKHEEKAVDPLDYME